MTYRWKVGKMFLLGHSRKGQSVEVSLDTFGRLNFWNRQKVDAPLQRLAGENQSGGRAARPGEEVRSVNGALHGRVSLPLQT